MSESLRRRCNWCGICLRWWQLNFCRPCKRALASDRPSAPFAEASRWGGSRCRYWPACQHLSPDDCLGTLAAADTPEGEQ